MASSFTWLDYSENDRRKMVEVISSFGEQDTRDELGIGAIRDGFADMLFPGTSTIQTRARYFLFIPWMYLALENNEVSSAEAAQWARSRETTLIGALEKAGEHRGNIGREARDKLKRLPSNIYWQGLDAWGIRNFRGSQAQYQRSLDRFYLTKGRGLLSDDKEPVAGFSESNWNIVGYFSSTSLTSSPYSPTLRLSNTHTHLSQSPLLLSLHSPQTGTRHVSPTHTPSRLTLSRLRSATLLLIIPHSLTV